MAEAVSRIPAWKRLGLALKNEAHAQVTAPEPSTVQSHPQPQVPHASGDGNYGQTYSPIEPAGNGKPLKLGKRKHQHDATEEDGPTTKKGKQTTAATDTSATSATTTTDVPIPAEVDRTQVSSTLSSHLPPEASQPKGDPNYRKRKAKSNQNKRRDHEDIPVEPVLDQDDAHHARSAVSLDAPVLSKGRRTLLASTETNEQALAPATTPQRHRGTSKSSNKDTSGSPTGFDRRKSVTFTPDTKRTDGSSAQDLFKKWVAEQKGADFDFATAESAGVTPANGSQEQVQLKTKSREEEKSKALLDTDDSRSKHNSTSASVVQDPPKPVSATNPIVLKGKKKDPSIYISYLTQYHTDRGHWKFNKAKQNDVVDNALNIFRIPDEHSEALLQYVQGLKGAGVIERLRSRCEAMLKDLEKEDANMDDPSARQAIREEAMQTRISKERKRRKVEGDVEDLLHHPHGDGYIRRLRRKRAEALLAALGRAAPILPALHTNGGNAMLKHVAPMRDSKKRKRRGDVSSDDSSSESSSDDDSSSESEASDSSDVDSDSSSSSSDSEDSDSDSDSGSGSDLSVGNGADSD
jgi:hypothetical protein